MSKRTIGRLAKESGVGVETIRYYERRGLIERPPRLRGAGWRAYEDRAFWTLRYIRIGQELGFTLKEMAELLAGAADGAPKFCLRMRAAVRQKLTEVEEELQRLGHRRQALTEFLDACTKRSGTHCPILIHLEASE
jgi:DNA-binding transcriptional MerR regulator